MTRDIIVISQSEAIAHHGREVEWDMSHERVHRHRASQLIAEGVATWRTAAHKELVRISGVHTQWQPRRSGRVGPTVLQLV